MAAKHPKTEHDYSQEQQKNLNNHARELLTHMHKLNPMKLKPGLRGILGHTPTKQTGPILQLPDPNGATEL